MTWEIKGKEQLIKTCFAFLPKKIGRYRVWLSKYYKTWDYSYQDIYTCYIPHYFINKETAVKYVKRKNSDNSE